MRRRRRAQSPLGSRARGNRWVRWWIQSGWTTTAFDTAESNQEFAEWGPKMIIFHRARFGAQVKVPLKRSAKQKLTVCECRVWSTRSMTRVATPAFLQKPPPCKSVDELGGALEHNGCLDKASAKSSRWKSTQVSKDSLTAAPH